MKQLTTFEPQIAKTRLTGEMAIALEGWSRRGEWQQLLDWQNAFEWQMAIAFEWQQLWKGGAVEANGNSF